MEKIKYKIEDILSSIEKYLEIDAKILLDTYQYIQEFIDEKILKL